MVAPADGSPDNKPVKEAAEERWALLCSPSAFPFDRHWLSSESVIISALEYVFHGGRVLVKKYILLLGIFHIGSFNIKDAYMLHFYMNRIGGVWSTTNCIAYIFKLFKTDVYSAYKNRFHQNIITTTT